MSQDSHVLAPEPATDLAVAEAMVGELEQYLINDDLYRTVITRAPQGEVRVQMTGGDLLTRLHRLNFERSHLDAAKQARIDAVSREAGQITYSLRGRFHARLLREMKARMDSLRWYLDDAMANSAAARANYPYEIRNRQRIEEIVKALGDEMPAEHTAQLQAVDRRLHALVQGGGFVWDPALSAAFPKSPYWYLYARL